ncbi:MAG: hypothetical protein JRI57_00245 [Deltaproteobacteria bacterium]|nr:hypothetical protein [Deltaproteobacteria bacterium]MBW1951500.1 hypothetical protein [Deltaproteobacteria bacterium]MBW1987419.1 hypothetical protein [Deltaproteobacteria bacterium]MBW2135489.1 hypothetical protein [Deltaproteobacteria bacterium]
MVRVILHLSLGVGLFFFQILVLPLNQNRLDLLSLLVFYEGSRPFVYTAIFLAFLLGLVVDCYSYAPLGLQSGLYLVVVSLARVLRRQLNLQYIVPQILAVGLTLGVQGLLQSGILDLLYPAGVFDVKIVQFHLERAGATALLAPPGFLVLDWLDKTAGRYFLHYKSALSGTEKLD